MRCQLATGFACAQDRLGGCRYSGCFNDDGAIVAVRRIEIPRSKVQHQRWIVLNSACDFIREFINLSLVRYGKRLRRPPLAKKVIGRLSFRTESENENGLLFEFL